MQFHATSLSEKIPGKPVQSGAGFQLSCQTGDRRHCGPRQVDFLVRPPTAMEELRVVFESILAFSDRQSLDGFTLPEAKFLEKHFYSRPGLAESRAKAALEDADTLKDFLAELSPSLESSYPAHVHLLTGLKNDLEAVWPAVKKANRQGWFKLYPRTEIVPVSFGYGGTFEWENSDTGSVFVRVSDTMGLEEARQVRLTALHLFVGLGIRESLAPSKNFAHEDFQRLVGLLCSRHFKIAGYPEPGGEPTEIDRQVEAFVKRENSWKGRLLGNSFDLRKGTSPA